MAGRTVHPPEPPRGWRTFPDGHLCCPHRDGSVCRDCATHPAVVEVVAQHVWAPTPAERTVPAVLRQGQPVDLDAAAALADAQRAAARVP